MNSIEIPQSRKKSFSSFTYKEAFKQLGVTELERWSVAAEPVPISDFFRQRLERLQRFDLESLEVSKTLLIDAICEEGLAGKDRPFIMSGLLSIQILHLSAINSLKFERI